MRPIDSLNVAGRILPPAERARYLQEWSADRQADPDAWSMTGAYRVAVVRRLRWWGLAVTGGRGPGVLGIGWTAIGVAVVAGWLIGGPFLVLAGALVVGVVVAAPIAGLRSVGWWWAMSCSAVLAIGGGFYFWWALGARLDAADAGVPEPAGTPFGGAALVTCLVGATVFLASAVMVGRRRPSH